MYVPMLEYLIGQQEPYAHCAWCDLYAELKRGVTFNKVKGILGAYCTRKPQQEKKWFVKIPDYKAPAGAASLQCPPLMSIDEGDQDSKDYILDPTNPVLCLADVRPDHRQHYVIPETPSTYA